MIYQKRLVIRIIIAVILALNLSIFYKIFSPLTLQLTKLTLLQYKPVFIDSLIIIDGHMLEFIPACTAASAYLLLALIILLTEMPFKKMLMAFITGSLIILAFNSIRIHILINILLTKGTNLFETLHLFFWKILATLLVVLTWILLTKIYSIKSVPVYTDIKKLDNLRKK